MINIQTDLLPLSPSSLIKIWCSTNGRHTLERIATEGTQQQKDSLIDWGYSNLPAWFLEDLYFMATGKEWQEDWLIMKQVTVKPLSSKAKNRLANLMQNNANCIVEQEHNGKLFLASANAQYFFWVKPSDPHWSIV